MRKNLLKKYNLSYLITQIKNRYCYKMNFVESFRYLAIFKPVEKK